MDEPKFKNKYRSSSARWQHWDYRWAGAYFITICTQNRAHYFGKIENGKMILSNIGVLADVFWHEIKNHAQDVELGEFVVMPNHVHGILILNKNDDTNTDAVDSGHALNLPPQHHQTIGQQRFQNIGKNSVSSIIGGYKSAVSKHAHRLEFDFAWQPSFHDHVIRDEKSFERIAHYIAHNPQNWDRDKFRHRL